MLQRWGWRVAVGLVTIGLGVATAAPALGEPGGADPLQVASAAQLRPAGVSGTDSDGDLIPDGIERLLCGTATCALPTTDSDHDGVPDWTELAACGTATCAVPSADADGDGIPDYLEQLVCGSARCSAGREDADGDGIPDWVEYLICGTATCASGAEDFDGDGVPDALAIKGSYAATGGRATPAAPVGIGLAAVGLVLLAVALLLVRGRRPRRSATHGVA